jgi:hypothetical protein
MLVCLVVFLTDGTVRGMAPGNASRLHQPHRGRLARRDDAAGLPRSDAMPALQGHLLAALEDQEWAGQLAHGDRTGIALETPVFLVVPAQLANYGCSINH